MVQVAFERYPHVAAYLRQLPDGYESYPEVKVKASTIVEMAKTLPSDFPLAEIDGPLGELLRRPPPVSSWLPEVHACCLSLAVRDVGFPDDETYLAWIEQSFVDFWQSSLYRMLMAVASPASLARGAGKRWAALRKGSERRMIEMHPNGNLARVDYPEHLVTRLYVASTVRGIEVAYRMSRAKDPRTTIEEFTPTYYVTRTLYDRARPMEG